MTEPSSAIRLVIFDMDGVLDRYDLNARLEHLGAATGKSPDTIYAAIWGSGLEDAADAGQYSAKEYLKACSDRVGARITRDAWVAARRAAMTPNREVLSLVSVLKQRTGIAVLTNNGFLVKETFGQMFPELPPLFGDRLHVAAEFGTRKTRSRSLSPPRRPPRHHAAVRDDDRRQARERRGRGSGRAYRAPLCKRGGAHAAAENAAFVMSVDKPASRRAKGTAFFFMKQE